VLGAAFWLFSSRVVVWRSNRIVVGLETVVARTPQQKRRDVEVRVLFAAGGAFAHLGVRVGGTDALQGGRTSTAITAARACTTSGHPSRCYRCTDGRCF
jgi:hypothetical protein